MPATSKAQRRLFALALAVKRGEVPESDVDDKIKDLSKKSEQDLKDYAETPEETLPNKVEDNIEENNAMATPGSVNGMGAVSLPGNPGTNETGSGDLAASSALTKGNPDKDGKKAKEIYKFLKFNAFVGESLNEAKKAMFFHPWRTKVDGGVHGFYHLEPFMYDGDMDDDSYKGSTNNTGGRGTSKQYPSDVQKAIEKYGIPTPKELKADTYINKAMWKLSKQVPRSAFRKFDFRKFGQGSSSNMQYAYVGNNTYEIHLNLPRAIRHPDEYSWVDDKDIEIFDKIESGLQDIVDNLKRMGFKATISSQPEGFIK